MTLLLQGIDVKVCFMWSLLQETGSGKTNHSSLCLWYITEAAAGKKLPRSSCNVVLLARSLTTAKDYTTWLMSNPSGKTNEKNVNPNRKLHIAP